MLRKSDYEFKNLTKAQQDCLTLIESLGIYELRALARVFGDNSPTILRRDDHIKIVMDKIIAGEDLRAIPLRPGRPYKELSNIQGILAELSQLTGKDYSAHANQSHPIVRAPKVVTFKQVQEDVFSQKLLPIEVRGVLVPRNDKEFFLSDQNSNRIVLVKKESYPKLMSYDFITGRAYVMNSENEYMLDSISSVNFQKYEDYHPTVSLKPRVTPTKTVKIDGKDVLLGSRYILQNLKINQDSQQFQPILQDFKANKIVTLALVPNMMEEDLKGLNKIGFNNIFVAQYKDSPTSVYDTFNNFTNHVERLQQQGYSLALFVQDITTFAEAIDFTFKNNTKALMGHTETAVNLIKKLITLANTDEDNRSTTLFVTMDECDVHDQMFVSSVYKISKKF